MTVVENLTKDAAIRLVEERVVRASDAIWTVSIAGHLVLVAGVARSCLLGEAEIWLVRGPYFSRYRMRTLRVLPHLYGWVKRQYAVLFARVGPEGERLVEFVGMKFVGWSEWPDGRRWKRYEE